MNGTKPYFPEVDIVKGITILLVVLGHSFCQYPMDLNSQFPVLGEWVRSFQMPLFFIASGFLFSFKDSFGIFLRKKASRLLLPMFVFGLASLCLKYIFSSFTHSGNISFLSGLYDIVQGHYYWFLYALMIIMVACRVIRNGKILVLLSVASIMCCLFTDVKEVSAFDLGRIIYYFPFFVLGYYFRLKYSVLSEYPKAVFVCIIFTLLLYVLSMQVYDVKIAQLYAVTLFGSAFTWGISVLLSKIGSMSVLRHFGHYSLQYYLNHLLIMLPVYYAVNVLISPNLPGLQLLSVWIIGVAISWVMLQIERRIKLLRVLCGMPNN